MNEFRQIENIRQLVKITMILLTLTHSSYGTLFYFLGLHPMVNIKFIEAFIALIATIFILKIDKYHNIAVYFTHASVLISCSICTYMLGQGYGFLIVMIMLLSLGYVHDFRSSKYPLIIGIFEVVLFLATAIVTKDIPDFESDYKVFVYIFNIINITAVIIFYSSYTHSIDVNESKMLEKESVKLQNKADYDYLTNILNRRAMNEILHIYHNYFQKDQIRSMVIVLGDIDNFKSLNDECGHNFGDIVLKNTAKIIKDKLNKRASSYVSRWGGEEFLILLTGLNIDESEELINEIREDFSNYTHKDGYNARKTTITFGICYSLRLESIDYMLSQADSALYNGKKSGKNKVETIVLGQI
ncbi:GGDEF domain-containing protein [Campylobacter sp. RM12642]|uniref:GGDEF domain-containing protein n=1 Tax=unclassified Campylobacter TaxID=2593542 RepID=UPI001DFDD270|nr:GGDEF domain-containing protein [Campylobacter sp. RM12642]MBZ8006870.1 GGDEF domain-containing protein [Campylobacter sp. RM9334]